MAKTTKEEAIQPLIDVASGPMAGLPVSAEDVNVTGGDIARQFQAVCQRADAYKQFMDHYSAQDLADQYGITLDASNLLKSAVGEMDALVQAHNTGSAFMSRIRGMGAV